MNHSGQECNAPSLMQSRQRNRDEIKEGGDAQCDLDICHKESGFDHSLGHWGERRFRPGIQGRGEKEASSDISRNSLKDV